MLIPYILANKQKPCRHIITCTLHSSKNSHQTQIPIRFPSPSGHTVTHTHTSQISLNQDSPQRYLAALRWMLQKPSNEPSGSGHLFWKKKSHQRGTGSIEFNFVFLQQSGRLAVHMLFALRVVITCNHPWSVHNITPNRRSKRDPQTIAITCYNEAA